MKKRNLKIFSLAILVSIPLGWGTVLLSERLEDALLARELKGNPGILAAYAAQEQLELLLQQEQPLRVKPAQLLTLDAQAGYAVLIQEDKTKVLFEKQSEAALPIASVSKLMTALVALQHYPPDQLIPFSSESSENEMFTVRDLLYLSLIESNNDAARALAQPLNEQTFVDLMNQGASSLGLLHTSFSSPSGLDHEETRQATNYSSARDTAKLAAYLFEEYPQLFDILGQQQFNLYTPQGSFHHTIENTNEMLNWSSWPTKIYGGKTGWTIQARGALLLIVESPDTNGYIVNVILGSEDRFTEMKKMLTWILQSYQW
jgi:D-alanyl-D-alanine carboxypeptidase